MEYRIKVSKQAERDLIKARCHFKVYDLEEEFDNDLKKQTGYLKVNPFLFQVYYRNVRMVHFEEFRYSIHYIIKKDRVYILRVIHQKQRFK